MLKKDLIDLANALRAENSTLRTQLEAQRAAPTGHHTPKALRDACAKLAAQYPGRKSFTGEEVRRACSA